MKTNLLHRCDGPGFFTCQEEGGRLHPQRRPPRRRRGLHLLGVGEGGWQMMGRRRPSSTSSSSLSWVTAERLQGSTGNAGAAMRLVAARRWQQGWFLFFSSLSPYSGFPCSRPRHGDKEGKSKCQGKETQRPTRAYIKKTGRRTG
jgi:hypothetical protein